MSTILRLILIQAIAKHILICGGPGYGKSTLARNIFCGLLLSDIPCTVIELAKREWRSLKRLSNCSDVMLRDAIAAVKVCTMGNSELNSFKNNPFEAVLRTSIDTRIGNLRQCFNGAISMTPPLPEIIGLAIERMLYDFEGRDVSPTMHDLYGYVIKLVDKKGYSSELDTNIKGAVRSRFDGLTTGNAGRIFQCERSVPAPSDFLGESRIIEADALAGEELRLQLLFLLARFWECVKSIPPSSRPIEHVIFIEEAHVCLGVNSNGRPDEDAPDPMSYVTEIVCRILAEFRARKVGVIICDQSPHNLSPLVLKNTGTKIPFRLQDAEDAKIMGNAMLLDELHIEELGRLGVGEAYFWSEGMYRASKIKTINLEEDFKMDLMSDSELLEIISKGPWFPDETERRCENQLIQFGQALTLFSDHVKRACESTHALDKQFLDALDSGRGLGQCLQNMQRRDARSIRRALEDALDHFQVQPLRYVLPGKESIARCDTLIQKTYNAFVHRVEKELMPNAKRCLECLGRLLSYGQPTQKG